MSNEEPDLWGHGNPSSPAYSAGTPIADDGPPRCAGCGYLLVGLTRGRCPECGRAFDLADRRSFESRPPYRFFTYWLPAAIGLGVIWFAYAAVLLMNNSVGWALTLGVPSTVGFVAGYGARPGKLAMIWLGFAVLAGVVASLIFASLVGVFCGVILGVIGLIPYLLGAVVGITLNRWMKSRPDYSQRFYLPILLALAVPGIVELAERRWSTKPAIVAQATPMLLHASIDQAWHVGANASPSVPRSPLHAINLTRPVEQKGQMALGARSTVRFSKGSLVVAVTERDEARHRFRVDYVGQSHVEDRAIRLLDTAFDLEPIAARETQVTITTRYEPLMTPRWAWGPFERWAGEATHELVVRQMQRNIDRLY